MSDHTKSSLYQESGVDVAKGDALVDWLKDGAAATSSPYGRTVEGIGGFSALFRPDFKGMKDPLLVSGTDGVGTKVLLGLHYDRLEGLGIDLVAMCVNDLYTLGATPLFFLDYYATGTLDEQQFKRILTGIRQGLAPCRAALLGGETAELPGLYAKGHFDLAGFVVGVVDNEHRLGAHRVREGDRLIALASSGFHSNGYSLVRKWFAEIEPEPQDVTHALEPTRIYHQIPELITRLGHGALHALAHITGGGISGNLVRVIPDGLACEIVRAKVPTPPWMSTLCARHGAGFDQVESIFNMGAGMIAAVERSSADRFAAEASRVGLEATVIGEITAHSGKAQVIYI